LPEESKIKENTIPKISFWERKKFIPFPQGKNSNYKHKNFDQKKGCFKNYED
jgi:hypothetical protein